MRLWRFSLVAEKLSGEAQLPSKDEGEVARKAK